MPSEISQGRVPYQPFAATINVPPPPSGQCPQSMADLKKWFSSSTVEFKSGSTLFAYTAGSYNNAIPADRTMPRLMFDDQGRYIGMLVWSPDLGDWVRGAVVGQLMTIVRSATTVADDMENKLLTGWHLANGSTAGVPNLSANDAFFQGASPNYDLYTVVYTGS